MLRLHRETHTWKLPSGDITGWRWVTEWTIGDPPVARTMHVDEETRSKCGNFGPHSHFGCQLREGHKGPHYNSTLGEMWQGNPPVYRRVSEDPHAFREHKGNDDILTQRQLYGEST